MKGGMPLCVRFDVSQAVAVDQGDVRDPVGEGTVVDRVEALHFDVVGGDDDLAAFVKGDVVFGGEVGQEGNASATECGFEAAGFVVEAGVDDSGVMTGLVGGRVVFLFEEGDVGGVAADEDLASDCGSDDS